ncbi:jg5971, partial [Pararge aegeria aegeria]
MQSIFLTIVKFPRWSNTDDELLRPMPGSAQENCLKMTIQHGDDIQIRKGK